jgi:hypothetical protein
MLGEALIQEACNVRNTGESNHTLRTILLLNAGVAVITSGAALVVLLIAPLGLAAVLSCTGLMAALSFGLGVGADLWLWNGLGGDWNRRGFPDSQGWEARHESRGLPPMAGPGDLSPRRRP